MTQAIYPVTSAVYVLEVKDALGLWQRMSDRKDTLRLMKLYIQTLWPEGTTADRVRVVEIATTESLLAPEAWNG